MNEQERSVALSIDGSATGLGNQAATGVEPGGAGAEPAVWAGASQYVMIAKARELSDLLAESEEVREFAAAEEAMLNDPEAARLLKEAEEAKGYTHFTAATRDKALMKRAMDDFYKAEAAQRDYPPIHRYNEAKDRLQYLLDRLNAIITFPITGSDSITSGGGGCGSGGGSCGGCSR